MTVRDINRALLTGKHVVARYTLDGQEHQGRIIRARLTKGVLQGKTLGSQRWVALTAQAVWVA